MSSEEISHTHECAWRFAHFELDAAARELRDDAGRVVSLEARSLDLLITLIRHRDRALSKDELLERVWERRIVTDGALTQAVFKLRRALGETDAAGSCIRTLHGRGFQWIAPVEPLPKRTRDQPSAAAAERAPTPNPPRLARLRFGAAALIVVAVCALAAIAWYTHAARETIPELVVAPLRIDATLSKPPEWAQAGGLVSLVAELVNDRALSARASDSTSTTLNGDALAQRLRRESGASDVLEISLRAQGSVFELDLLLRRSDRGEWKDALFGESLASLAVDAAARVRRQYALDGSLKPDDRGFSETNGYLAETYARGLAAQAAGKLDEANRYYRICVEQSPDLLWPRLRLADSERWLGRSQDAHRILLELFEIPAARNDAPLRLQLLYLLGMVESDLGNVERARGYLATELLEAEQMHGTDEVIGAHIDLATFENARNGSAAAIEHLSAALREIEQEPAPTRQRRRARIYALFGVVENARGRTAQGAGYLTKALEMYTALGNRDGEMHALRNLALAQFAENHVLDALAISRRALQLSQEAADDWSATWTSRNIAHMLSELDPELALRYADRALHVANSMQDPNVKAVAQLSYAEALRQNAQHAAAAVAFEQALAFFAQAEHKGFFIEAAVGAARNARAMHDLKSAREFVQRAFAVTTAEPSDRAKVLSERAAIALNGNDVASARADFAAAVAQVQAADDVPLQKQLRARWVEACLDLNRPDLIEPGMLRDLAADDSPLALKLRVRAGAPDSGSSAAQQALAALMQAPILRDLARDLDGTPVSPGADPVTVVR